jgi:hypothetical protein
LSIKIRNKTKTLYHKYSNNISTIITIDYVQVNLTLRLRVIDISYARHDKMKNINTQYDSCMHVLDQSQIKERSNI